MLPSLSSFSFYELLFMELVCVNGNLGRHINFTLTALLLLTVCQLASGKLFFASVALPQPSLSMYSFILSSRYYMVWKDHSYLDSTKFWMQLGWTSFVAFSLELVSNISFSCSYLSISAASKLIILPLLSKVTLSPVLFSHNISCFGYYLSSEHIPVISTASFHICVLSDLSSFTDQLTFGITAWQSTVIILSQKSTCNFSK